MFQIPSDAADSINPVRENIEITEAIMQRLMSCGMSTVVRAKSVTRVLAEEICKASIHGLSDASPDLPYPIECRLKNSTNHNTSYPSISDFNATAYMTVRDVCIMVELGENIGDAE